LSANLCPRVLGDKEKFLEYHYPASDALSVCSMTFGCRRSLDVILVPEELDLDREDHDPHKQANSSIVPCSAPYRCYESLTDTNSASTYHRQTSSIQLNYKGRDWIRESRRRLTTGIIFEARTMPESAVALRKGTTSCNKS
jgi:hypothetical protein